MSIVQAIVIGIVQGLTEFLPISSTAHLKIVPALLGWPDPGPAFSAVIQWGTLVAALAYFRADIARLTKAMLGDLRQMRCCTSPDSRLAWMIVLGTVPIVICGIVFKRLIEEDLRSLYVMSGALIGLALLLAAGEAWYAGRQRAGKPFKHVDEMSWLDAMTVGVAQAIALIPGVSRSGVTILGGIFRGMNRADAARYSFLLSLPAIFAAGVFELKTQWPELTRSNMAVANLVAASIAAAVVGYASIAFLLHFLKHHSTWVFIIYRLILGALILALLNAGRLQA